MNDLLRFESLFIPEPMSGCWLWEGAITTTGRNLKGKPYSSSSRPVFRYEGRAQSSSRVSWKIYKASIPDGMGVLHTCDNSLCVNPDHLFLGTHQDNMEDAKQKKRMHGGIVRGTHCPHGHEYTEENTRWRMCRGKKQAACRACDKIREAAYKHSPGYWAKLERRKLNRIRKT